MELSSELKLESEICFQLMSHVEEDLHSTLWKKSSNAGEFSVLIVQTLRSSTTVWYGPETMKSIKIL